MGRSNNKLPTPEEMSRAARILGSKTRLKGNVKKLRPCRFCGEMYGAREMRLHVPRCRKR